MKSVFISIGILVLIGTGGFFLYEAAYSQGETRGYIDGYNQGHAIIAFNTIDEGLVYFDPQSDETATPAMGKRYYKCLETKQGYRYEEPSHDDTIMGILVIW